jgi:hypothetical protein
VGDLKWGNHTEQCLVAQAFVFTCESKVTAIGDIGIYARVLLRRLVNGNNAPYKLSTHE